MLVKQIINYGAIGILNTIVHWISFYIILKLISFQSISNLLAFLVAVLFSFYMNGRFTFKKRVTPLKMVVYILIMGGVNCISGFFSDIYNMQPVITLIISTILSFILGFLFSKYLVFKG